MMSVKKQMAAALLTLMISAGAASSQVAPSQPLRAEEIGPLPRPAGPELFVDVTAQGEVLEVDYARKTARTLGFLQLGRRLVWQGWAWDRGASGLLLLLEPTQKPGTFARVYLYSTPEPKLEKTSLLLDLGEYAVVPVSARLAYVQDYDLETRQAHQFVFDLSTNTVVGSFDFSINERSIHAFRSPGRLLFADPVTSRILIIDAGTHKLLQEVDVATIVKPSSGERVFVVALGSRHTLVAKFLEKQQARLSLLDATWSVVAESEAHSFFTGKFFLDEPPDGGVRVACLEETVRKGQRQPSGVVKLFELSGRRLILSREISFDPEKEIALRSDDGWSVHPRYTFDYLSATSLAREILLRLGRFFKSPEPLNATYDQIMKEFEKSVAESAERVPLTRIP